MNLRRLVHRFQDRVLTSLGGDPDARGAILRVMLSPKTGEAGGFWLQLTIATMLATLGLVLSSTAVVIGAMLIAPLMKPLVGLAMGLATGSAELALRSAVRTVASIVVVVLVAMAITTLLPFHEITAELQARTAPSLLDLAIAGACALAASYATFRSDADIATTAAGTSIGISLVPPLCACGYGLALRDLDVARGAALLFTANLSGILAVAAVMFVAAGFIRVDLQGLDETPDERHARRASVRIGRAFNKAAVKRLGPFARIVPPLVLLGIVYVPLQGAVGEITHRTQIRQGVAELLASDQRRVVQYTLEHTASAVILRVVVVGDASTAADLEAALRRRLASLDVPEPKLSVWAVPDAASISALSHRVDELPPPIAPEPVTQTVHRYTADLAKVIRGVWPQGSGELVAITLDLDRPDRIRITHLGAPLGAPALQLLATSVKPQAGDVTITEDALVAVEAAAGEGATWLPAAIDLVGRLRRTSGLRACLTVPRPPEKPRGRAPTPPPSGDDELVRTIVDALVAPSPDLTVTLGDRWQVVPSRAACPVTAVTPVTPVTPAQP